MRRMLSSNRSAQSKFKGNRKAVVHCVTAGLMVLFCSSLSAQTQQVSNYPISTTTMTLGAAPISSGAEIPIVDASYFGAKQSSEVKRASYWGDLGYQALQDAECRPGAYGCIRCDFDWYFNAEFVGFRREGDRRFTLTQQFMTDVDFEFGTRLTIGKMSDCSSAYEFVYVGPFEWTRGSSRMDPGNVNSRFFAFPDDLNAVFNNADQHDQSWLARASSFELNHRKWAWDAVSTLIGFRYFNYEERYALASTRSAVGPPPLDGRYSDEIDNHLVGAQIGGDIFFVTSLKTSISLRGKAGAYANFGTREVRLVEDGVSRIFNGVDKVDFSGLIEFGISGNYQITPSIRLNAGYDLWYIPGIAAVSDQSPNILTEFSGNRIRFEEDLFLHGFSTGVQILY